MMAWVTDSPHWMNKRDTSIEYRFLSSMQGSLGVGANLNKWTARRLRCSKDDDRRIQRYARNRAARQPLSPHLAA